MPKKTAEITRQGNYRINPELWDKIDDYIQKHGIKTKAEFINMAFAAQIGVENPPVVREEYRLVDITKDDLAYHCFKLLETDAGKKLFFEFLTSEETGKHLEPLIARTVQNILNPLFRPKE